MNYSETTNSGNPPRRCPWNKGKLVGPKPPLRPSHVWSIRAKLQIERRVRDLDLQALQRVRERLVRQRAGIINQIRAFLLERGVAVRQGLRFLRTELPGILAKRSDVLFAAHDAHPRTWQATGAGLTSASKACPPTSRAWWRKTRRASV